MWSELSKPWQACLELAWEAYCDDCIPIGAVVTGSDGKILTRGRNRISGKIKAGGQGNGQPLAHAEMEALRGVDYAAMDPHVCVLYTTTEPCPMCMGTFYMSGLRTLRFLARDPFAGSVNLLGTTWYLSRKPIKVFGPNELLEILIMAMAVEQEYSRHGGVLPGGDFYRIWREAAPRGVELGETLCRSGELQRLRKQGRTARTTLNLLASRVK